MENIEAIKLFSHTLIEIVNGELNQMFKGRCQVSREDYYQRIYAKTASMFQTGAKSTALITTPDPEKATALAKFGHDIGIAFQIIDDILDFTGEQATVGKPVASDLRQGLITLPAIIYIEEHPQEKDVQLLLQGKCLEGEKNINHLVESIRGSNAIKLSHQHARDYVASGIKALELFPPSPERLALEELACFIVNRDI
jgi:geranylgeranyl pyrophosphate synthase